MGIYLLRRRGHGKDSCQAILERSQFLDGVWRIDRRAPRNVKRIINWGLTSEIPLTHPNIINNPRSIIQTSNKKTFRMKLNEAGLSPKTWDMVRDAEYPAVVRPSHHSGGEQFHVVKNAQEAEQAVRQCGQGAYLSKLIDKAAEYRVFVVQGRVACVARKTPPNAEQVAWNHTYGSTFQNVRFLDWPLKSCRLAIEAFNLSELDFGAVDVIVGKDGGVYVLEINTAPALESDYRATSLAKCLDWLVTKGKDRIGIVKAKGGALKYMHPALSSKAIVPQGVEGVVRD